MTLRLSGGRRLQSPPGDTARPTAARVRQAVLNLLAADLPGCRWLDLCCGSGVMACEALQRGAAEVVAIERDRRVAAVAKANLQAVAAGLGSPPPRLRVIQVDARRFLASRAPSSQAFGGQEPGDAPPTHSEGAVAPERPAPAAQPPAALKPKADRGSKEGGQSRRDGRLRAGSELQPPTDEPSLVEGWACEEPFDLVYCDPPWPAGLHIPLSQAVARGGWIRPGGTLVWECPSNQVPLPPAGWCVRDQRRYGGSTVVLLEPL